MKYRTREKIKSINQGKRPILMVKKSNKYFYVQLVDSAGKVVASASDKDLSKSKDKISQLAKNVASQAKKAKIEEIVFDRSPYPYKGKVRKLAEALRKEGLNF